MASVPPLPPGWTEHIAPGGQPYYFNAATNQSTYIRPLPTFPLIPTPSSIQINSVSDTKSKKKEKPKVKTPVPGTPWLRVTTTAGNVFFTHTERKESVWTVPEEIKEAVEELERAEKDAQLAVTNEVEKEAAEIERIKDEVQQAIAKRKLDDGPVPLEEVDISQKRARVDEEEDEGEEEEEEEEWQREAAAQLAAEAEEEAQRLQQEEEAEKKLKEAEEAELRSREKAKGMPALNMPNRVELSPDEAKALFKTLLREKDINPLLPWDTALPSFISDPRYVLLPSVSARRDAFDEYCRERVREIRAAKVAAAAATADAGALTKSSPKEAFEKLLKEEVKSTRTIWNEWRRAWKKDRRFYGWGRDDREREKRFRDWLKELGEQKRKAAEAAEKDFFALLKEKGNVRSSSVWKEIKRGLDKDPRYDAVGSSSLREELFNTFVKTLASSSRLGATNELSGKSAQHGDNTETDKKERDKERKERAVRDREAQVRRERERLEAEVGRSKNALSREEGELQFRTMLTDAIRNPLTSWEGALPALHSDPRFANSPLPHNVQRHLFGEHVSALRLKHERALHALFETHAPGLADPFDKMPIESVRASLPAVKLGLGITEDNKFGDGADEGEDDERKTKKGDRELRSRLKLEDEFNRWQRRRRDDAESAFQDMLNENAFVEYWGRAQKMAEDKARKLDEEGEGMRVEMDDVDLIGEDVAEDADDRTDHQKSAKGVDVKEIERVLKNDKRYMMFAHMPEQREVWIKEHLERMAAPKLSVHVPT